MNRVILVLNAVILVVNFFLSYASSSSQIGLLESATHATGGPLRSGVRRTDDVAFLHLAQSLNGVIPANRTAKLTKGQLLAVRNAMRYYRQATRAGVSNALDGDSTVPAMPALDQIGRQVRLEIEEALGLAIRDDLLVQQLTTAVIRFG